MATFYSIHAFDEDDMDNDSGYFDLYSTFDKACDAMDKKILEMLKEYDRVVISDFVFDPPDREELKKEIEKNNWVRYYRILFKKFTICKATVVE